MKLTTRIYGTIITILVVANSFGQTIEEASALFARKQLDSALVVAKNLIDQENTNVNAYVLAGRILVAKKKIDREHPHLNHSRRSHGIGRSQRTCDWPLHHQRSNHRNAELLLPLRGLADQRLGQEPTLGKSRR